MKSILLILLSSLSLSCNSGVKSKEGVPLNSISDQTTHSQIGDYVVEIFQDSQGNLWFGTLEKGVAKYDGNKLVYLTKNDGLPSNRIVSIIEDSSKNLWFGTGEGLSKFDGKTFTNYSEKEGLCSNMISNLFIDSKGYFWIGTWKGVCKFDGTRFEKFSIPYPEIDTKINPDTKDWITSIIEDSKGTIWFGRDGYGASRFDGNSFSHFTIKEGLNQIMCNPFARTKEGNFWIGTRVAEKDLADESKRFGNGGLNKYDAKTFTQFPEISGLSENDVYAIYRDPSNHIWISTIRNGVYKYHNQEFINYQVPNPTMSFLKDKNGTIWLGCAGGLYKITKDGEVLNVKTNGPWK